MEILGRMQATNFGFLEKHDPLLLQLATTAEQAFVPDPNSTLLKLRQLGEALAQDIASRLGIEVEERSSQKDLSLGWGWVNYARGTPYVGTGNPL